MTPIRAATPADARAIAEVQTRAWWRAYQDIVEPEVLAGQSAEDREERWREHLADPATVTIVAEVAGRVAGFATYGPSRADGTGDGQGELYAIYVDPPAQGAGLGTALLDATIERMSGAGWTRATLTVFEANGHARGFYERHGWRWDGAPAVADEWAPVVRYHREHLLG